MTEEGLTTDSLSVPPMALLGNITTTIIDHKIIYYSILLLPLNGF
jgi:hypothetical protein